MQPTTAFHQLPTHFEAPDDGVERRGVDIELSGSLRDGDSGTSDD